MKNDNTETEASRKYATAYETHYDTKNLREAFGLYKQILIRFPDTKEAVYAMSQAQNIVNTIVPKAERQRSQLSLADAVFDQTPI